MHLRSFRKGKKKYYFIAETKRQDTKMIQKAVLYLGTADRIYEKLKPKKV